MAIASTSNGATVADRPPETIKSQSMALQWTGRVLTGLTVLFMLFDAWGKFTKPSYVSDAFLRLGLPMSMSTTIGTLLLISTVLYAIPRTAVLGAVLLTGFLGGAISVQMRAGTTTFEQVFPVIFGILMWGGIYLRECGLRRVFPVKR
jgi:hypothetical protein